MFREKIKNIRLENNLKQSELAKKLYLTPSTISDWERGRSEPNNNQLIELSKIFNVTVDYLLDIENEDGTINLHQDLTPNEQFLVESYNQLSEFAQHRLIAYTEGLLTNPMAKKNFR